MMFPQGRYATWTPGALPLGQLAYKEKAAQLIITDCSMPL